MVLPLNKTNLKNVFDNVSTTAIALLQQLESAELHVTKMRNFFVKQMTDVMVKIVYILYMQHI